jgi:hypothetical protein
MAKIPVPLAAREAAPGGLTWVVCDGASAVATGEEIWAWVRTPVQKSNSVVVQWRSYFMSYLGWVIELSIEVRTPGSSEPGSVLLPSSFGC